MLSRQITIGQPILKPCETLGGGQTRSTGGGEEFTLVGLEFYRFVIDTINW